MWLFRWCIKHLEWKKPEEYKSDTSESTENLRKLIKSISQKLAAYDETVKSGHVTVSFPSDNFAFEAKSLGQPFPKNQILAIQEFNQKIRKDEDDEPSFIAEPNEILEITKLALELLNFADFHNQEEIGAENVKLDWLKKVLAEYPSSKFLLFTESLQTCEIITKALPRESEKLTGDMSLSERESVVAKLRNPSSSVKLLVATSAADEGFDFQVANRVIHWDLSPNPAVLMQRNGRVARLGQISDVTAYYLIIPGTHEQIRENALLERFAAIGINDQKMRDKIAGVLTPEQEDRIFSYARNGQSTFIDEILKQAEADEKDREKKLSELQRVISEQWVVSRKELENGWS